MNQADLLAYAVRVLEELGAPYMLVGSLASSAYGDPRMTRDIDFVIDVTTAQVRTLCAAFPSDQFYVSPEAALQALSLPAGQFNVIHPESGNKIDFMIARRDAWGKEQVSRRQRVQILPEISGYAARPEDVVLGKLLYYQEGGSEKHLRDIASILKVGGNAVDRDYIERWATDLGVADVWQAVLNRLAM